MSNWSLAEYFFDIYIPMYIVYKDMIYIYNYIYIYMIYTLTL